MLLANLIMVSLEEKIEQFPSRFYSLYTQGGKASVPDRILGLNSNSKKNDLLEREAGQYLTWRGYEIHFGSGGGTDYSNIKLIIQHKSSPVLEADLDALTKVVAQREGIGGGSPKDISCYQATINKPSLHLRNGLLCIQFGINPEKIGRAHV